MVNLEVDVWGKIIKHPVNDLLTVLAQTSFDKKAALLQLAAVKEKRFDKEKRIWKYQTSAGDFTVYNPDDILLGAIAESFFDKSIAEDAFKRAHQEKLIYIQDKNLWCFMTEREEIKIIRVDTAHELLGIIAQAQFDKVKAKKMYEQFKDSQFFNKDLNNWRPFGFESDGKINAVLGDAEEGQSTNLKLLDLYIRSIIYPTTQTDVSKKDLPVVREF